MNTRYDPKKIKMTIGGLPVTGFASGTMVTVSRNSPKTSMEGGVQGEQTHNISADDSGTVTFNLKQSSISQLIGRGLNVLKDANNSTPVFVPIVITNLNEGGGFLETIICTDCTFTGYNEVTMGDTEQAQELVFNASQIIHK